MYQQQRQPQTPQQMQQFASMAPQQPQQFINRSNPDSHVHNQDEQKKKKTLAERLEELKNIPKEKQIYVFGMEIQLTGITNLNQESQIHSTFGSPFAENPSITTNSLNYVIPQSYTKPQVVLNPALIKKFPDETLFYLFYNYPDEQHQLTAVQVLYERNWIYHPQMMTWMKNIKEIDQNLQNLYSCEFFNITQWKQMKIDSISMKLDSDLALLQDFMLSDSKQTVNQSTQENVN